MQGLFGEENKRHHTAYAFALLVNLAQQVDSSLEHAYKPTEYMQQQFLYFC